MENNNTNLVHFIEVPDDSMELDTKLDETYYNRAVSYPGFQAACCEIILAFLKQGKLQAAESAIEKILPLHLNHQSNYALLEKIKDTYYALKSAYPSFIEVVPEIIYKSFADICWEVKEYTDAVCLYKRLIDINPKSKSTHNRLGILYQCIGKYDKAERSYQRAIQIDQKYKEAHYNLGCLYFSLRQYGLARKSTRAALKIDPYYARARQLWKEINYVVARGTDALGRLYSREIVIEHGGGDSEGTWVSIGASGEISPTDAGIRWVKGR